MKELLAFLVCILIMSSLSVAQTPYSLNSKREWTLVGAGTGLNGISFLLQSRLDPLTEEQMASLDKKDIWKLDRWVVGHFSVEAQRTSDAVLYSSFALPAVLLFDKPIRQDLGKFGLIYFQTLLLNYGVSNLAKSLVKRPRPFMFDQSDKIPFALKTKKAARYSFFSSHTSFTAALSFLTAKIHHDVNPKSGLSGALWGLAAAVPAYTGLQRIRGGKHFLTDVIVGYVVGAAIGILIPEIHRN